ncbi:MAG: class I SAM-dependent methyltransferase [Gammaproteobacteria bacterium]|nr:class I SAM-dependent methyltransferase [Gammaproteobacteria bacterium]
MQSYSSIRDLLHFNNDLPYTRDWSAAADFLKIIIDECLLSKPSSIMECSSGLTTLILARCCQINNKGHVYSLEHESEYQLKTIKQLDEFGLAEFATVIYAPLDTITVNSENYLWYDTGLIPDIMTDMVVIDGPPGHIQKNSRYPALPILAEKIVENSKIFLDDAARDDEKSIIELWKKDYPGITHEYQDTERGCSIITMHHE